MDVAISFPEEDHFFIDWFESSNQTKTNFSLFQESLSPMDSSRQPNKSLEAL